MHLAAKFTFRSAASFKTFKMVFYSIPIEIDPLAFKMKSSSSLRITCFLYQQQIVSSFKKKGDYKGFTKYLLLGDIFIQVRRHFFRATAGVDRIFPFWRSAGLPEKELWIKWHLLQRPGYQATNKSDVTAAYEVCLANRRWHELLVLKICRLTHFPKELRFLKLSSNDIRITFSKWKKMRTAQKDVYSFSLSTWEPDLYVYHSSVATQVVVYSLLPGAICPKLVVPLKVKSGAHTVIWHFSSSSIEPLQFSYCSIWNVLIYSRIDFYP